MKKLLITAVAAVLVTGTTTAAAETPGLRLPGPSGPLPVGTSELHLVDGGRTDPWTGAPRELMVSVSYPALPNGRVTRLFPDGVAEFYDRQVAVPAGTFAPTTTHSRAGATPLPRQEHHHRSGDQGAQHPARLPVILYSPGGGQSRFLGTTLVEDLVSRGYAVVSVDHTPASPVRFPDRLELPRSGADAAQVMRERVRDIGFVLDELAANPLLDLSRVGMVGHSMGGFTTAETMLTDPRVDAGVNLDGSMDPRYGQAATLGVSRPFLLMGGGLSSGLPHNHAHSDDWGAFWSASTGWRRDVYLPDAEHMSFTDAQALLPQLGRDATAMIGTIDPDRSLAAQRTYVAAFFDLHLRGRQTTIFDRATHPDVRLIP
ncbi:prolyl oligopeptidase family serine peptidase [Umezawaea endophytica]|uniref:Prolyl oligopeptidase family serine peptidase n=1 Tax=Umezawaea endophytica TaxID=1654476 RepID=A0A9X2VKF1_9PSEU|nr:prolyl oligopeptidase family serine peptidase [Umezawaea endophytica]MCS7478278.1 prolyl oligopeptidase family serine peptidase [Umezawaea endophytica]